MESQKEERVLDAPATHPLSVILAELKFGRPAAAQNLLDKWIAEVKELED